MVSILILAMLPLRELSSVFLAKPIVLSMSEKTFVRLELCAGHLRVVECYMGMKTA